MHQLVQTLDMILTITYLIAPHAIHTLMFYQINSGVLKVVAFLIEFISYIHCSLIEPEIFSYQLAFF